MKILIAASGSGGHLFPALHIARALRDADSSIEIEFIGAGRPLEEKLVRPLYPVHVVAASRVMQQGITGVAKFFLTLPTAVRQLNALFAQLSPAVVVGVGGYASVIPVAYAALRGIPTLIHEAERRPGLANRVLAPFARVVSVARDECRIFGTRTRLTAGQPMRDGLTMVPPAREIPRTLLVMGGSQGAAALDGAAAAISRVASAAGLTVIHQTRHDGVEAVRSAYAAHGVSAEVVSFISEMAEVYGRSDLVISRAGANSVSELEVVGRPVVFVPYPHAQGDHQAENAHALTAAGRAVICAEGAQFEERLEQQLRSLLQLSGASSDSGPTYSSMRRSPESTRNERAAGVIAQRILALAKGQ